MLLKFIRERYHKPEMVPIKYHFIHPLCQGSLSLAVFISKITALFHIQQQFSSCASNPSEIKTLLMLSCKAWHLLKVNRGMSSSHASLEKLFLDFSFNVED